MSKDRIKEAKKIIWKLQRNQKNKFSVYDQLALSLHLFFLVAFFNYTAGKIKTNLFSWFIWS